MTGGPRDRLLETDVVGGLATTVAKDAPADPFRRLGLTIGGKETWFDGWSLGRPRADQVDFTT
jgi:hypothetical protein